MLANLKLNENDRQNLEKMWAIPPKEEHLRPHHRSNAGHGKIKNKLHPLCLFLFKKILAKSEMVILKFHS